MILGQIKKFFLLALTIALALTVVIFSFTARAEDLFDVEHQYIFVNPPQEFQAGIYAYEPTESLTGEVTYTGSGNCVVTTSGGCAVDLHAQFLKQASSEAGVTNYATTTLLITVDNDTGVAELMDASTGTTIEIDILGTSNVDPDIDNPDSNGGISVELVITNLQDALADRSVGPILFTLQNSSGQSVGTFSSGVITSQPPGNLIIATFDNVLADSGYTITVSEDGRVFAAESDITVSAGAVAPVSITVDLATFEAGITGPTTPTCESENPGLGWIVCPTMDALTGFLDELTVDEDGGGFLGNILNFDLNEGNQREALDSVWAGFRTLANLLFVVAFLIIIYSAASGSVLSAYDVKRLLPRLVIAAIGVQLSLALSTWLLDFSNDLGTGAGSLLLAPLPDDASSSILGGSSLGSALDGVFQFLYVILAIIVALLSIVGVIMMAFVFIIRNMAILILIVLSPIAFVAWILPNSERMFKKWWEWYMQMLMVFPIAALFFASGKLISYIWIGAGEGVGSGAVGSVLIGTIALFAPYYMAPKLLTFAGSTLRSIGSGMDNAKNKVGQMEFAQRGKARAKAAGYGVAKRSLNRTLGKAGTYEGPSRARRKLSRFGGATIGRVGNTKAMERVSARASEQVRKIENEDATAARINLDNERAFVATKAAKLGESTDAAEIDFLKSQLAEGSSASDERKRAAVKILLDVHSSDTTNGAISAVREFRERMVNSTSTSERELGGVVIEDNLGIAGQVPQVFKPASAGTIAGMDASQRNSLKGGSLVDFVKSDDEAAAALIDAAKQDYSNPNTRGLVKTSQVVTIREALDDKIKSLQDTEENKERKDNLISLRNSLDSSGLPGTTEYTPGGIGSAATAVRPPTTTPTSTTPMPSASESVQNLRENPPKPINPQEININQQPPQSPRGNDENENQ